MLYKCERLKGNYVRPTYKQVKTMNGTMQYAHTVYVLKWEDQESDNVALFLIQSSAYINMPALKVILSASASTI